MRRLTISFFHIFVFASLFFFSFTIQAQNWKEAVNKGDSYFDKKEYKEAEKYFTEALQLVEQQFGKQDTLYARMHYNLFHTAYMQNQMQKAQSHAEEMKAIYGLKLGKESGMYADALRCLGFALQNQGLFTKAITEQLELQEIILKVNGKKSLAYASICNNLGFSYQRLGKHKEAIPLFIDCKDIREQLIGKNTIEYTNACSNLGICFQRIGDYDKAEQLFLEALAIKEKLFGLQHPEIGKSQASLAFLYKVKGLYGKAEAYYLSSLQLLEDQKNTPNSEYINSINNLGSLYYTEGLYTKAEQKFLEGISLLEQNNLKSHPTYALFCHNLACVYVDQGFAAKAESLFEEAARIREATLGKGSSEFAMSALALARINGDKKQFKEALEYYELAKNVTASTYGKNSPEYAQTCHDQAITLKQILSTDEQEQLYLEAIRIIEKLYSSEHLDYARFHSSLGIFYFNSKNSEKAKEHFLKAQNSFQAVLQNTFPLLSEKERASFLKLIENSLNDFQYFSTVYSQKHPELVSYLFDNILFSKSLVFASTIKMKSQILASGDSVLIKDYERWLVQKEKLNQLNNNYLRDEAVSGSSLKELADEVNKLEKSLSQRSLHFAQNSELKKHTWQELRSSLGKNEAAIEILRISGVKSGETKPSTQYIALIVTDKTSNGPELLLLPDSQELETKFLNYYRTSLTLKKEDKSSYNVYWKPIEEKLKALNPNGFDRIYISPDGVFHQISLAGLKNPESGKYISEQCKLQMVGTCRDIIEYSSTNHKKLKELAKGRQVHLYGYPSYSANEETTGNTENREIRYSGIQDALGENVTWNALPGTKKEVEFIDNILKNSGFDTRTYEAKEATEESIKSLQNPLILHVATHGYFVQEYAGILNTFTDVEKRNLLKEPFQRCGLALAGCSDPKPGKEDGILTASEAMNLHLDNTELVVLSACETGLGDIVNGEGVFGLQRAFQQAGAKTIVMSLWKVNDEATQLLMNEFYKQLAKGKSKRDAFGLAQASLRKQFDHPYYWAAFVMIGE